MTAPLLERLEGLEAKATKGPWVDLRERMNAALKSDKKRRGKWYHGTRESSTMVELIAQDNFQGEPVNDSDLPTRCDLWDLRKVFMLRWCLFPKRRTSISEGFFSEEDRALIVALRNASPALLRLWRAAEALNAASIETDEDIEMVEFKSALAALRSEQ